MAWRDARFIVGLVALLGVYLLVQSGAEGASFDARMQGVLNLRLDSPLAPGFWMDEVVSALLKGSAPSYIYPFALLTNAAFALMLARISAGLLYRGNLFLAGEGVTRAGAGGRGWHPGQRFAFLRKDLRLFFRDSEQWGQLVIIWALVFVYVYNFKSIPVDVIMGLTPYAEVLVALLNVTISGLVLAAVAARFLYVGVSIEGGAFWVVKSAPVTMRRFLLNKYLYGFIPVTLLMLVVVGSANILVNAHAGTFALTLCTVFLLCASVSGLAGGMGALRPQFRYESLTAVSMGLGSVMFMVAAFMLVLVSVGLIGGAVFLHMQVGVTGLALTPRAFGL